MSTLEKLLASCELDEVRLPKRTESEVVLVSLLTREAGGACEVRSLVRW